MVLQTRHNPSGYPIRPRVNPTRVAARRLSHPPADGRLPAGVSGTIPVRHIRSPPNPPTGPRGAPREAK